MAVKSISALEALEFLLVEFTKNVHRDAHCPSHFAMRDKNQHYKVHARRLESARSALCPLTG